MQSPEVLPVGVGEYSVSCVEKVDAPDGAKGAGWCRYVISRKNSTIVGVRNGTVNQVTSYAREFADRLNERAAGKSSSSWARSQKR